MLAPVALCFLSTEPALRVPAEKIQEHQWLAETLGGLYQLLFVLLQDSPGTCIALWPSPLALLTCASAMALATNYTLLTHPPSTFWEEIRVLSFGFLLGATL